MADWLEEESFEISEEEAKQQLEQWKNQYGNVYVTEIDGIYFVWRELSLAEFRKSINYYEDYLDRSEYVCRQCVLDPVDFDYSSEEHAGIPETLSYQIVEASGFLEGSNKIEQLMIEYENEMTHLYNQIACVIVEAFPKYDIEEVENWPIDKMIRYYTRAKWILSTLRGIELTMENKQ